MFDPDKMLVFWQKGKGKNLSLDVKFALNSPDDTSDKGPMEMHNGNLSRYVLRLTDHASNPPVALMYNLPSDDIPDLAEEYEYILHELQNYRRKKNAVDEPADPAENKPLSPAYTAIIPFGKFKGMTPASVLIENSANRNDLNGTLQILLKNADKYESNRRNAAAIEEAIKLFDEHKLEANVKPVEAPNDDSFDLLYEPDGPRFGRNSLPDGYRVILGMKITCHYNNKYPWRLTFTSCEAPMMKTGDGNALPELSKSRNHKNKTINLRKKDFSRLMDYILGRRRDFEINSFPEQLKKMQEEQRKNREAFKKMQEEQKNK